ncbi:protein far1-related sequence 5-like [Gigaspora margarita]|uniref:Protein far1-related sequence 5-like n=1 Tax=Gigaspora margarita TaxID=4874 RepID=A0A8H4ATF2_GIGMA|nr:protein far1-related sequence 5-like [Gigaspora margarita]
MNPPPPSGYENNSLVNRNLFSPLSESNNNCLPTSIHRNNISFNDHDSDFDNISLPYSKSSNNNFEDTDLLPHFDYKDHSLVNTSFFSPLSESNNNCLPISIQGNNGDDTLVDDIMMYIMQYKLRQNNDERLDSVSLLDRLFEKMHQIRAEKYLLDILDSGHQTNVWQVISQRNKFGIAFSTAKTAINIALEMNCDNELVKLLKNFISIKQNSHNKDDISEEKENGENDDNGDSIITLQKNLIDQTNDSHVTKIRSAPNKKRIKSAIEMSKKI